MKKLGMLFCMLCMSLMPGLSRAQGIENGDSMLSVYLGVGSAVNKSGLEVEGKNLSWGNIGWEGGLSYLYFPVSFLGMGVNIRYAGFQGSNNVEYIPGHWHWHTLESKMQTHTLQLMGAGRINLNPASSVRVYMPFGAGLVLTNSLMTYTWDDYYEQREHSLDTSFGWYAGVGVEFEQRNGAAWAIEARYNTFRYKDSYFAERIGAVPTAKNSSYNYVSLSVSYNF